MAEGVVRLTIDERAALAAIKRLEAEQKRANAASERAAAKAAAEQARTDRYLLGVRLRSLADAERAEARRHKETVANLRAEADAAKTGFAGVAGVIAGLSALTKVIVDQQNALTDWGTQTGLARETIAGLQRAAEGSGQGLEQLAGPLRQFPKRLADFAAGTGEAKRGLEGLGLEVEDLPLSDLDGSLRTVLDRIAALPTEAERAAVATQIFGEAGGALAQAGLLAAGGLDAYTAAAVAAGVANAEAGEAAAQLQQDLADAGQAARGAGAELLGAFGGEIHTVVRNLSALLKAGFAGALESVTDQIEVLRAASAVLRATMARDWDELTRATLRFQAATADALDVRDDLKAAADAGAEYLATTRELTAATADHAAAEEHRGRRTSHTREEIVAATEATDDGTDAARRQALALAQQAQALREAADPALRLARIEGELREATVAGGLAAEDAAAIRAAAYAEVAEAAEQAAEREAAARARAAEAAARAAQQEADALADLRDQRIESVQALSDSVAATADLLQIAIDRRTGMVEDLQERLDDADADLTDRQRARIEAQLAEQQALLIAAAKRQKAAAVTASILSGAAAIAAALASPPGPPLNTPTVVATTVAAGAQVATAASTPIPSFDDTPAVQQARDGRTTVSFKDGDYFAAAQKQGDLLAQVLRDTLGRRRIDYAPAPSPRVELRIGVGGSRQIVRAARAGARGVARTTSPVGG